MLHARCLGSQCFAGGVWCLENLVLVGTEEPRSPKGQVWFLGHSAALLVRVTIDLHIGRVEYLLSVLSEDVK
jgi:hypothetical protein